MFLTSLAIMLCCATRTWSVSLLGAASLVALGVACCEAVTPHGLDNFTIPVAGGILLRLLEIVPRGVDHLLPATQLMTRFHAGAPVNDCKEDQPIASEESKAR